MVKADDSGPRGPGFKSSETLKKSIYSMNVMFNAPMTCLALNRPQTSSNGGT